MHTQGGYQNLLGNNRILVSNAAGPAQCGVEFVCKETHRKKTHSTIARVAYPQRVVREVAGRLRFRRVVNLPQLSAQILSDQIRCAFAINPSAGNIPQFFARFKNFY